MKPSIKEFRKCQKSEEDILTRSYTRNISLIFTKYLVQTDLTPNQITVIGFTVTLLAAFLLTTGVYFYFVIGAILVQLSLIIDCVDGEVSRLKKMTSKFGKWLDSSLDRIGIFILLMALSLGFYQQMKDLLVLLLGIITMSSFYLCELIDMPIEGKVNSSRKYNSDFIKKVTKVFHIKFSYIGYSASLIRLVISIGLLFNNVFFIFGFFIVTLNAISLVTFVRVYADTKKTMRRS
jgi:phosphatidylglycerophosphate synthase